MKFTNTTTFKQYEQAKNYFEYSFESVPNTAAGYDCMRKIINKRNFSYKVGMNTERDYWLSFEDSYNKLFLTFQVDGDEVTIVHATDNGKHYTADRYLKKYVLLLAEITTILKYERLLQYRSYPIREY